MNLAILSKKTNIVVPVHGFLVACRYLGITIAVEDHGLRLVSPHGTGLDVLGNDRTLYNLVVRDSVQYAILQQLEERTSNPERTRYRKDLAGADPYIALPPRVSISCTQASLRTSTRTTRAKA